MSARIRLLWLLEVVPFVALPLLTIAQTQPQPWYSSHALFHIVYLPIIGAAVLVALGLALYQEAPQSIRRLAWATVALQLAGLIGHFGELVAVGRSGGLDAGEEIYELPGHEVFAALTVPALAISILVLLVMTGIALRERGQVTGGGPEKSKAADDSLARLTSPESRSKVDQAKSFEEGR